MVGPTSSAARLSKPGELDLEAPVAKYWPEFARTIPEKSQVTIRHVMSHRSGFPLGPRGFRPEQWVDPAARERAVALAEEFSPERALEAGFLDELTSPDRLLGQAQTKAASLLELDAFALAAREFQALQNPVGQHVERYRDHREVEDFHTRSRPRPRTSRLSRVPAERTRVPGRCR